MRGIKVALAATAAALTITASYGIAQAFTITTVASTVPPNGDENPYGIVVVPKSIGNLVGGDIIISNFNNGHNLQGTGTTIVEIGPHGTRSVFAHIDATKLPGPCPGGVGLTTALAVTSTGWVFVGSLPTTNGMSPTAKAGCILVINSRGRVVETFSGGPINGPWDMTALQAGDFVGLWVTNVLNGTVAANGRVVHRATVIRLAVFAPQDRMPRVLSMSMIGSGFPARTDSAALVIGPTGVALSQDRKFLFVADSLDNRIAAIPNPIFRTTSAGVGMTLTRGGALNDPLGMTIAPDGDVLTANGDDGFLVRTNLHGMQVSKTLIDASGSPPGSGALFGLTFDQGVGLFYVDDATNTLNLLH